MGRHKYNKPDVDDIMMPPAVWDRRGLAQVTKMMDYQLLTDLDFIDPRAFHSRNHIAYPIWRAIGDAVESP